MKEDSKELQIFLDRVRSAISNRLRELGWSLKQLTEEADITYVSLYKMMQGKHAPNTRTLFKIFRVLDLDLEVVNANRT